jgi:hypothetical protein
MHKTYIPDLKACPLLKACESELRTPEVQLYIPRQSMLRLGRTMRRCLRFGPGLCLLFFGSPTFFSSYDTFMTVSRFVLGSSIRVLVFRLISLIWLDSCNPSLSILWQWPIIASQGKGGYVCNLAHLGLQICSRCMYMVLMDG